MKKIILLISVMLTHAVSVSATETAAQTAPVNEGLSLLIAVAMLGIILVSNISKHKQFKMIEKGGLDNILKKMSNSSAKFRSGSQNSDDSWRIHQQMNEEQFRMQQQMNEEQLRMHQQMEHDMREAQRAAEEAQRAANDAMNASMNNLFM